MALLDKVSDRERVKVGVTGRKALVCLRDERPTSNDLA